MTENRLNDIASSAIFQGYERCFLPALSEFEHIKMRNGAITHLKAAYDPPVGNHWIIVKAFQHFQPTN